MRSFFCFLAAMLLVSAVSAQTIYESTGKSGTVYSDRPGRITDQSVQSEKVVDLPPINVFNPPPQPLTQPGVVAPVAKAPAFSYKLLSIIEPEAGSTIHSNTGQISIRAKLDPELQVGLGHVIATRLDNTFLATKHKSLFFDISPEDWIVAAADNVEHKLEVAVIDATGRVFVLSDPVYFYVHHATPN